MINLDRVRQEGNQIGKGDIVGGNKEINDYSQNFFGVNPTKPFEQQTHLARLAIELEKQVKSGEITDGLIDEALRYLSTKPETDVVGLEEKLKNAQWGKIVEQGLILKEAYHKKLLKTTNYKAAQEIHCLLLKKTVTVFFKYIKPILSEEGLSCIQLNSIIDKKLTKPILEELGPNVLDIYEDEVSGMLYSLTGNCHLNWK